MPNCKKKLLTKVCLRWLKVHHTGYKDITIKSSNMDWIKEGSVYDVSRNYMLQAKKTKRDGRKRQLGERDNKNGPHAVT